jgi:hypothetical protein
VEEPPDDAGEDARDDRDAAQEDDPNPLAHAFKPPVFKVPDLGSMFSASAAEKLAQMGNIGETIRRQQDEMDEVMRQIAAADARRAARKAAAEDASIATADLLEVLLEVSRSQQEQLAAMTTQLAAMTSLLEAMTAQAVAASQTDDERWALAWPLNQDMRRWAVTAGVAAIVGVFVGVVAVIVTVAVS